MSTHDQANHPPTLPQERAAGLPRSRTGLIVVKDTVITLARAGPNCGPEHHCPRTAFAPQVGSGSEKFLRGLELIDRGDVACRLGPTEEVTADALTFGERHEATAINVDERCTVGVEDATGISRDGGGAVPAIIGGMGGGW
jgi:hypothetical protein